MLPKVDIFRVGDNGLLWIEAAADVETAKARVNALSENSPGRYLIFNQDTGNRFEIETPEKENTSQ